MLPAPLSTSACTHTQSNFTPFWAQHFSGLSFHYCSKTLAKYRVLLTELLQLTRTWAAFADTWIPVKISHMSWKCFRFEQFLLQFSLQFSYKIT